MLNDRSKAKPSSSAREPTAIGSVLKSTEYYLKANRQGLLAVQDCLTRILAPELLEHTQVVGVHGGVLTLAVPDAAGKCLLEATLRGSGLQQLQKALPQMSLRKTKVVLT